MNFVLDTNYNNTAVYQNAHFFQITKSGNCKFLPSSSADYYDINTYSYPQYTAKLTANVYNSAINPGSTNYSAFTVEMGSAGRTSRIMLTLQPKGNKTVNISYNISSAYKMSSNTFSNSETGTISITPGSASYNTPIYSYNPGYENIQAESGSYAKVSGYIDVLLT